MHAHLLTCRRTLALVKKKNPDTEWLLLLMGLFMSDDEIFYKSYKWVKPKQDEEDEAYLSNDDNFFSGLP